MAVGGIVLAVASGDWMPAVDPVYRTLLQVFFAVQFIAVGFFLAMRRAVATALVAGVRNLALGRTALGLLFRQFERDDGVDRTGNDPKLTGEPVGAPLVTGGQLSAVLAEERLERIVSALAFGSIRRGRRRRRGILGWTQGTLMSAVGAITMRVFARKPASQGKSTQPV